MSFVVSGAAQASDSALTTASAEWKWINGWSAVATFEGEFSGVTRSYGVNGAVPMRGDGWHAGANVVIASEAKQSTLLRGSSLDCFVAALLAMTI